MSTISTIAETLGKLAEDLAPILPPDAQAPVRIVGVVLRDAAGVEDTLRDDFETFVARAAAAGRAIGQASHLAGMREAIMRTVPRLTPGEVSALLLEIARRTR